MVLVQLLYTLILKLSVELKCMILFTNIHVCMYMYMYLGINRQD